MTRPRETPKGQPLTWAAHRCRPPQTRAPAGLHYGGQAAGRVALWTGRPAVSGLSVPHPAPPDRSRGGLGRGGARRRGANPVNRATRHAGTRDQGEILLGTLHNYRITESLGRQASNMIATSVVVDTGAGASDIRPEALPDGRDAAITPHPPGSGVRLRDANGNQLVTSGTISLLWAGGCARPAPSR